MRHVGEAFAVAVSQEEWNSCAHTGQKMAWKSQPMCRGIFRKKEELPALKAKINHSNVMRRQKLLLWTAAILIGIGVSGLRPVEAKPPAKNDAGLSATNSVDIKTNAPAKPVEIKKQPSGAELYSMHCN